jgi:hypothetical protein
MTKINTYLAVGGAIVLLLIGAGTYVGWHLHKDLRPCPKIIHDTTIVYDTTTYYVHGTAPIQKPVIVFVPDTIIIPQGVDTMAILRDYYSIFKYVWSKQDTNINFNLQTTITQNRPINYDFSYKLLKPQTTIINTADNTVTYNKYIYGGIGIPISSTKINETSANILYAFPRGYAGIGWSPITNTFIANAGLKICNFKVKK